MVKFSAHSQSFSPAKYSVPSFGLEAKLIVQLETDRPGKEAIDCDSEKGVGLHCHPRGVRDNYLLTKDAVWTWLPVA